MNRVSMEVVVEEETDSEHDEDESRNEPLFRSKLQNELMDLKLESQGNNSDTEGMRSTNIAAIEKKDFEVDSSSSIDLPQDICIDEESDNDSDSEEEKKVPINRKKESFDFET